MYLACSRTIFFAVAVALVIAACGRNATPAPTRSPAEIQAAFPTSGCQTNRSGTIGLEVGGRGQVLTASGLSVRDEAFGTGIAELDFLETFVVLEAPQCRRAYPSTSTASVSHTRRWRVRSETRDVEGWIEEYSSSIVGIYYFISGLENESDTIAAGNALAEAVSISGTLQGRAERLQIIGVINHTITFEDYGYVVADVQQRTHPVEDPAQYSSAADCKPVIVMLTDPTVGLNRSSHLLSLHISNASADEFKPLFVKPREHEIIVTWDLGVVCPDVDYTITISPVEP